MKNTTTCVLLLLLSYIACSQNNKQAVINASGGFFQQGYYQFEWSVGEMSLVNQMNDATNKLTVTNGFIQPHILYPARNNDQQPFDANEIRIFPNPATSYVEINLSTKQKGRLSIYFYDVLGKKVYVKELTGNGVDLIERIPVTGLPQGVYILHIELVPDPGSVSKKADFKVVKTE
jgi:hypothetical protein